MAAYQQPPYQTTVMQPVIVQPVVVPLYSRPRFDTPRFMMNAGPAYLRNGAKLGNFFVPGCCVLITSFIGVGMLLISLIILASTNWDMEFWRQFDMTFPPLAYPAIVIGTIGLILLIISCHLCQTAKKGHGYSRQGEPGFGQPDTAADPGNSSGHVYSNQGQPAVGKPVTAIAAPVYMPVQPGVFGGAVYSQQGMVVQPGGFTGPMYPQQSTVTTVSYPNTAPVNQPPQPGFHNAPGEMPYPEAPPYSGPENNFAPPEYKQQPAFAPPSYNP